MVSNERKQDEFGVGDNKCFLVVYVCRSVTLVVDAPMRGHSSLSSFLVDALARVCVIVDG